MKNDDRVSATEVGSNEMTRSRGGRLARVLRRPSVRVALGLGLLLGAASPAEAQSILSTLELRDGGVLEGTVLSEDADAGVRFITVDGDLLTVAPAQIASLQHPSLAKPPAPEPEQAAPRPIRQPAAGITVRIGREVRGGLSTLLRWGTLGIVET